MSSRSLWIGPPLVLASRSAARRALLANAGIDVVVQASGVDERAIEREFLDGGGQTSDLARLLAEAKALDVSRARAGQPCLGADQTLDLDGALFHKAADRDGLALAISRLSGRTHRLTSAACVAVGGRILHQAVDHAHLTMRDLSPAAIEHYIDLAGPDVLNCVGGYQIEGLGVHLFDRIVGDSATIMGMPLMKLLPWFREAGFLAL